MKASTRIRLAYVFDHSFQAWLAGAAVISGLDFLLRPEAAERSPVTAALHDWAYAWNSLYVISGLLVIVGVYRLKPRVEVAGLSLLAGAVSVQLLAVATVYGMMALPTELIYLSLVSACLVRVWRLVKV